MTSEVLDPERADEDAPEPELPPDTLLYETLTADALLPVTVPKGWECGTDSFFTAPFG